MIIEVRKSVSRKTLRYEHALCHLLHVVRSHAHAFIDSWVYKSAQNLKSN